MNKIFSQMFQSVCVMDNDIILVINFPANILHLQDLLFRLEGEKRSVISGERARGPEGKSESSRQKVKRLLI